MRRRSSDEVRKRIANRRKNRERGMKKKSDRALWPQVAEEKESRMDHVITYEAEHHKEPPLLKKDWILFQILLSVCLVLAMAIIYRTSAPWTTQARVVMDRITQEEFQFAGMAAWFEDKLGQPLAFLPEPKNQADNHDDKEFAIPAAGTIMESFEKNGQGVIVKTPGSSAVETIEKGIVIYSGVKHSLGKTIIVQHPDKSESWYGNLQDIHVNLYEQVDKGKKIGIVSASKEAGKGEFYFAVKSNGVFIDPKEVVPFE